MTSTNSAISFSPAAANTSHERNFDVELDRLLGPISEYFSECSNSTVYEGNEELYKPVDPKGARSTLDIASVSSLCLSDEVLLEMRDGLSEQSNCLQNAQFQSMWQSMKLALQDGYSTMEALSVLGESLQLFFDVLKSVEENEPLLSGTNAASSLERDLSNSFDIKLQDAEAERLSDCLAKLQNLYRDFDHTTLDLRSSHFAHMVQELHDTCGTLRTFVLAVSLREVHYSRAVASLEKVCCLLRNGVEAALRDAEKAIFSSSVLSEAAEKCGTVTASAFEDELFSSPEATAKHVEGWMNVFSIVNHFYLDKMDESAPLRRYLELVGNDLREFLQESSFASMTGSPPSSSVSESLKLRPLFQMYINHRSQILKLLLRWWLLRGEGRESETILTSLTGNRERTPLNSAVEEPINEQEGRMSDLNVSMSLSLSSFTLPSAYATLTSFVEEIAVALEAFTKLEEEVANRVWLRHDFQLAILPPLNAALADSAYSVFRSRLLAEDSFEELAKTVERIEAVRSYCSKRRSLEMADLWMRMTQDTQERLIFRASIYLRQNLAEYIPTKELAEKYRAIRNDYKKNQEVDEETTANLTGISGSTLGQAGGTDSAATFSPASSPSPSFEYIPTFPLAVNLLRSLNGSLTLDVFSVLAEESIRLCLTQIMQLSRLMHSMSPPDEKLLAFLTELAHLRYLHYHLSLLDAKITVVEKKIDLGQSMRLRKIKISENSRESIESVENQFTTCYQKLVEIMKNGVSQLAKKAGNREEDMRSASAEIQDLTKFYEYLLLRFVPDQWLRAKILLPVYQIVEGYRTN